MALASGGRKPPDERQASVASRHQGAYAPRSPLSSWQPQDVDRAVGVAGGEVPAIVRQDRGPERAGPVPGLQLFAGDRVPDGEFVVPVEPDDDAVASAIETEARVAAAAVDPVELASDSRHRSGQVPEQDVALHGGGQRLAVG